MEKDLEEELKQLIKDLPGVYLYNVGLGSAPVYAICYDGVVVGTVSSKTALLIIYSKYSKYDRKSNEWRLRLPDE